MAEYTQRHRPLKILTELGPDALLLARIDGEEAISRPFRYDLELVSPRMDVDGAALLRTPALVSLPLHDGSLRKIHGMISRFSQTGRDEDLATYRAELVAWPWFLSLQRNNRIFQGDTVLEIAEKIFGEWGFADFSFRCEDRPAREFVVQYGESDLDFLSRWLETEGIFYFFEHTDDAHVLVLADANSAFQPCPGISEAWVRGLDHLDMDVITSLTREHAVQVGRVTFKDYDYLQPSLSLEASEGDGIEFYEHTPGLFTTPDDGERYARYRLQGEEARGEEVFGIGNCRWMASGHSFELKGHFNSGMDGEYVLTSVRHSCSAGGFRTGETGDMDYSNTFLCIPADVAYRPPRVTPRPVVRGSQTAVVVGPSGEEVWTDDYGRVKVQFHWDREGSHDDGSSCWVRVATPWGGKGYGGLTIPRIGNEVLVDFLEGDPDRPIVVASVYNAEQMPPFAPGIQMGMKSRSSKGGGGYNEISATDTKGEEQVTIHAQYDMSTTVLHDQTLDVGNDQTIGIGNDRTESVGNDESITIGSNRTEQVGSNETITIGGNRTEQVGGDESITIGKSRTRTVTINDSITVGISQSINVGAAQSTAVGGNQSTTVGMNQSSKVGGDRSASVGKNDALKVGKKLTIDAGDEVVIKTGKASITMKKDGTIQISGKDITIKASGKLDAKASKDITMKGQKILQN